MNIQLSFEACRPALNVHNFLAWFSKLTSVLKMEALYISETLVFTYTRPHGVATPKTNIKIAIVVKTENLSKFTLLLGSVP